MTISTALSITPAKIKSRQINDADIPKVVELLTRGFAAHRTREFWQNILARLGKRSLPAELPRYGFLIESDGKPVGVLLMIFSRIWEGGEVKTRCNVSSWYVEKEFRGYAQMLVSQALKYKQTTVFNVSASPHTHAMAEIRGFRRSSNGMFAAIPTLSRAPAVGPVRVIDAHVQPDVPFDLHERNLLLEHAEFGCTSLWCITPERAYPFVFRPRHVKSVLRAQQLVYCSSFDDFVRFARPIGMHFARNLTFLVLLDSNGPVTGLVGKYFPEKMPRYFHGPDRPRLGDLAYTEISMFGV
jgi:hypothetical protein